MQVSLSQIKGTGPDGVIVKADVEEFIGISLLLGTYKSCVDAFTLDSSLSYQ